ncbi:short-chain dehydrogenase/reductase family 42E member 1-like [Haliotis rubra]|uniref:short-chain dehydrogenase/reductase family 42E member 1-like n=1 Tax=Haliotis rubra TaxID=36100 RepID=UPI001EE542B0|nr:short-chain dehydrogenase/reductase family 42E member 1-like [Haliotis rubra]
MKTRSSASKADEIHFITGGGGYPGYSLGKKLTEEGHRVKLFDIREPVWDLLTGMEFIKGDIRDASAVRSAVEGVDVVYHMASYGMSGREQLNKKLIQEVNIGGTENVLKACHDCNVTRLVYTSTYNVVFGGQEIRDGDESLPYLTEDKFTEYYSLTKMHSEKKVLGASGSQTADGSVLYTCALRLAGVYGPGEQRHIPRIVSYLEQGLVAVTYGAKDSLVDFLHVDNLVQAHMLAGRGLSENKGHIAAGQAYFICDDKPINNFQFFRPLIEGLGLPVPHCEPSTHSCVLFSVMCGVCPLWKYLGMMTGSLPDMSVFCVAAFITEIVHSVIGRRIYNFQPLLTRTEVYKTGVTHTFSIAKAHSQLGYSPTVQNDMTEVVRYYQKMGRVYHKPRTSGLRYSIENIIIGLLIACLIMSLLPTVFN